MKQLCAFCCTNSVRDIPFSCAPTRNKYDGGFSFTGSLITASKLGKDSMKCFVLSEEKRKRLHCECFECIADVYPFISGAQYKKDRNGAGGNYIIYADKIKGNTINPVSFYFLAVDSAPSF